MKNAPIAFRELLLIILGLGYWNETVVDSERRSEIDSQIHSHYHRANVVFNLSRNDTLRERCFNVAKPYH